MHNYELKLTISNDSNHKPIDKKRIEELRKKLRSPKYIKIATEKIAADLTHLLFR